MQTIVDHHHASDQKSATKVRFSEPGDEKDGNNEDDTKVTHTKKSINKNSIKRMNTNGKLNYLYSKGK